MSVIEEKENRERLLRNVKKECKQMMEISVARKCINQDNSCITSLCVAIESCLLYGLRKNGISLFKTSTTMGLLQKIGKQCSEAEQVLKLCQDYENNYGDIVISNQSNSSSPTMSNNITNTSMNSKNHGSIQLAHQESTGSFTSLKKLFTSNTNSIDATSISSRNDFNVHSFSPSFHKGSNCYKLLWIRLALLDKKLMKIIDYIVANSEKYYLPHALVADPVDGPIFSSLLIGPCTLEFTKAKTCDYMWTDPNADELIQRYKMRSSGTLPSSSMSQQNQHNFQYQLANKNFKTSINSIDIVGSEVVNESNVDGMYYNASKFKPSLNSSIIHKKKANVSALEDISNNLSLALNNELSYNSKTSINSASPKDNAPLSSSILNQTLLTDNKQQKPNSTNTNNSNNNIPPPNVLPQPLVPTSINNAKDYVESLHQNSKSQLIYGKNHVIVNQKEAEFAGYLSLHLNQNGLILKWTPNQLMNGSVSPSAKFYSEDIPPTIPPPPPSTLTKMRSYWDYALYIDINTIVYLHCHQQGNSGASIILVAQDGVQHPPIKFPKGSHLLQFLTCLENGLAPFGALDPPLVNEVGKGKSFPKSKINHITKTNQQSINNENEQCSQQASFESVNELQEEDIVFRIINSKSNVLIKPVSESYKKKLEFSLSSPSPPLVPSLSLSSPKSNRNSSSFSFSNTNTSVTKNFIHAILPNKFTKNQNKLGSILASRTPNNSVNINESVSTPTSTYSRKSFDLISTFSAESPTGQSSLSINMAQSDTNSYSISPTTTEQISILNNNYMALDLRRKNQLTRSVSVRSSVKSLCDNMKRQILSRAFYGWLLYHRNFKTVSVRLIGLINCDRDEEEDDDEQEQDNEDYLINQKKLDEELWRSWINENKLLKNKTNFYKIIYYNGIDSSNDNQLRKEIWPFLLGHYSMDMNENERELKDKQTRDDYARLLNEWRPFEEFINLKEQKKMANNLKEMKKQNNIKSKKKKASLSNQNKQIDIESHKLAKQNLSSINIGAKPSKNISLSYTNEADNNSLNNEVFDDDALSNSSTMTNNSSVKSVGLLTRLSSMNIFSKLMNQKTIDEDESAKDVNEGDSNLIADEIIEEEEEIEDEDSLKQKETEDKNKRIAQIFVKDIILKAQNKLSNGSVTYEATHDVNRQIESPTSTECESFYTDARNEFLSNATSSSLNTSTTKTNNEDETFHDVQSNIDKLEIIEPLSPSTPNTVENSKNLGPINENEPNNQLLFMKRSLSNNTLIDNFSLNMHRIDKDVTRCDRNYWYFVSNENLKKLKNIIYTYVWENLNIGYIQGMCDIVAPLLVIFDDEPLAYNCFKHLMKRMSSNFPHGNAMDQHFSNMRSLIQIVDTDLYEHMHHRGDYTHFYFSYRWFLLDFKRELVYDDVFSVWETIWAAKYVSSAHFYLFVALALIKTYRDIIIDNNMDFTEIIKFFNEMAEKHDTKEILAYARNLLQQLKNLIDNKA